MAKRGKKGKKGEKGKIGKLGEKGKSPTRWFKYSFRLLRRGKIGTGGYRDSGIPRTESSKYFLAGMFSTESSRQTSFTAITYCGHSHLEHTVVIANYRHPHPTHDRAIENYGHLKVRVPVIRDYSVICG